MIAGFCFALVFGIADIIIQSTRLQQNNDDGRAWLSMISQLAEVCILGGMFIYYLINIHPVILGR